MLSLGACTYGGGSYGDGYVNGSGYACDPYAPFDDYYACDNGYGYANIGFGGGWYDSFYYPGFGTYIFDRRGSRYAMQRHHRRHWARQRAEFGSRHARRGGNRQGWKQGQRRRDLTPEQRAERQDRRAERRRDLTPEQRAERRDRRAERRSDRNERGAAGGDATTRTRTGRAALRDGNLRGQRKAATRQTRSGDRQGKTTRSERSTRPAAAGQRGQKARPAVQQNTKRKSAPTTRKAPRRSPKARPASRASRDVNID